MQRRGQAVLAILAVVLLSGCSSGSSPDGELVVPDSSMQMTVDAGTSVRSAPTTDYRGRRGDVVVLRGVWGLPPDRIVMSRVVGLGGETVRCCDAQGRTLVNEVPLREGYVYLAPGQGTEQQSWPAVVVPPGSLWVLGDNRNAAVDSRSPGNGPVPEQSVVAVLTGDAVTCPPAAASCPTVEKLTSGHPHHAGN